MNLKTLVFTLCPSFLRPILGRIERSPMGYRLAKGAFWSIMGAVISRGMMFFALVFVGRILGPEVFGEYGMIRSAITMFGIFAGFGLGLTATKHVAQYRDSDPHRAGRIIAVSGLFAIVAGAIITFVLVMIAPWLAEYTINAPHLANELRIGALILFINSLNGAQTGSLAGFEAFKTIAKINLIAGLWSFPLMVVGAYFGGLTGSVWALAASMAVTWLLSHLALRSEAARFGIPFTFKGCLREWPIFWRFSLPATVSGIVASPIQWICRAFLVNQVGGYEQMGIFTAALAFQGVVLFAGVMLSRPLLSMLCNAEGRVDDRLGRINILSSWSMGIIVTLPLLCFPEIAEFLFGKAYGGAPFRITLVLVLFYTCILTYRQGLARVLAANNLMWWNLLENVIWAVINIGVAYHLVHWGSAGLAASFTIAYGFGVLVFVPLYAFMKLVPKGTLLSFEAITIWAVTGAFVVLNIFAVSFWLRGIALAISIPILGIAFWRLAKPIRNAVEQRDE